MDYVIFLDADMMPSDKFPKKIIEKSSLKNFILFGRGRGVGAAGSNVSPTWAVTKIGGYDEVFSGYGQEDIDYFERLRFLGGFSQHFYRMNQKLFYLIRLKIEISIIP